MNKFINAKSLKIEPKQKYNHTKLTATIPTTIATIERTFSAFRWPKTHCRGTEGLERLTSLSLLSIETTVSDDF